MGEGGDVVGAARAALAPASLKDGALLAPGQDLGLHSILEVVAPAEDHRRDMGRASSNDVVAGLARPADIVGSARLPAALGHSKGHDRNHLASSFTALGTGRRK